IVVVCFFFSSRRRHTRCYRDWSSDVCSSDLAGRIVRRGVMVPVAIVDRGRGLRTRVAGRPTGGRGIPNCQKQAAIAVELKRGKEIGRASCRERKESAGGSGEWKEEARKEVGV